MASERSAEVVRANTLIYLTLTDWVMLPGLAVFGRLHPAAIGLGIVLILPSLAGSVAGGALFRPGHERLHRGVGYLVITLAALSGLPYWG